MSQRKFSVVMATYDDPTRTIFTCMSVLLNQPLVGEVLVVDNNPTSEKGRTLAEFARGAAGRIRYVPMDSPKGTSPPRNRAIREAKHDHVVCLDSHVVLGRGSLDALAGFYEARGWDCPDLVHGPIVTEGLRLHSHLMNDQWRGQMWGTWGLAWRLPNGRIFSCRETPDQKRVQFVTLDMPQQVISLGDLFDLPLGGHERVLYERGCTHPTDPFHIPGYGMGMFATRRDDWLGFIDSARGFGGEEMSIHAKYRRAGRASWCAPNFVWWHHFAPADGRTPYRLTLWDKVRNYVQWFKELDMDPTPIRVHFVDSGLMNPAEWAQALAGAEWPVAAGSVDPKTVAPVPRDMAAPRPAPAVEDQPRPIVFDIDGVLNATPQRGSLGFGADPEKVARLMRIPGPKVCISYWRNNHAHEVKLPFEFTFAPKGNKGDSVPKNALVVIDDEPSHYRIGTPVYKVDGSKGLQDDDVYEILARIGKMDPIEASSRSSVVQAAMAEAAAAQPPGGSCGPCGSAEEVAERTLEERFRYHSTTPGDINEHLGTMRDLVKDAPRVCEMGTRYAVSTAAFLIAEPKVLTTYDLNRSAQGEALKRVVPPGTDYRVLVGDSTTVEIEECDLLFLDTDPHTAQRVHAELSRHHARVTSFILLHDTEVFGERFGDQPGVMPAVRKFIEERPEWFVSQHWTNNNGLTLLSRRPEDRPPGLPPLWKQGLTFARSMAKHWAAGGTFLSEEAAAARYAVCTTNGGRCPLKMRDPATDRCTKCSCHLKVRPDGSPGKVYYPMDGCPLGLWPTAEPPEVVDLVRAE